MIIIYPEPAWTRCVTVWFGDHGSREMGLDVVRLKRLAPSVLAVFVAILFVASPLVSIVAVGCEGTTQDPSRPAVVEPACPALAGLGQAFLANMGQFPDPEVSLYMDLPRGGLAFGRDRVLMNIVKPEGEAVPDREPGRYFKGEIWDRANTPGPATVGCTVSLTFEGANDVAPAGQGPLPGERNFLIGDDPSGWTTGVKAYSQVAYQGLYDDIDLVYRLDEGRIKYEFLVGPDGDPGDIVVRIEGHDALHVADGDLVIGTPAGPILDRHLVAFYQGSPAEEVPASFELLGDDAYRFRVTGREPGRRLVIDPFMYSTFLGSMDEDYMIAMDVDAVGNVHVTGYTWGMNFPTSPGAYQAVMRGESDAFVTKLNASGSGLVFSTFIGGDRYEVGLDILVEASGEVLVCGATNSDNFPTTSGVLQEDPGGGNVEGVLFRLSSSGKGLTTSTYVGADRRDVVTALALDDQGDIYITGETTSHNFTTTPRAFQAAKVRFEEAFVQKLSSDMKSLVYSTYLGGRDYDSAADIKADGDGNAYVGGVTESDDFPTTSEAYQTTFGRAYQMAFITKVSPDGSSLVYSTFLGGTGRWESQYLSALALDDGGAVHVVGLTESRSFPCTPGAFQSRLKGGVDAFVTKLSGDGSRVLASTFLGGNSWDDAQDVVLDDDGNPLLCGYTYSTNFPTKTGVAQGAIKGDEDGFLVKLTADYSRLLYSTYMGGTNWDEATCCDANGTLYGYAGGYTSSFNYPTTRGAYQTQAQSDGDAFVSMFVFDRKPPKAIAGRDVTVNQHKTVVLNGSKSTDNIGITNWTWSFRYRGQDVELYGPVTSWTFDDASHFTVTLRVTDLGRHTAMDTKEVEVRDITPPSVDAGPTKHLNQHEKASFVGTGSDNVGIANWTWSFHYGGETVRLYGRSTSFTFDDVGTYNVTLEASDAMGNTASDWTTVTVMDITMPIADAGPDLEVFQHQVVKLYGGASLDNVGIANYTWSFMYGGQPVTLLGAYQVFTFDLAGLYDVTLMVLDGAGNRGMDTMKVWVKDSDPPFVDAGPDLAIDQGETVDFDGTRSHDNVRILTYEWTFEYDGVDIVLDGPRPHFSFEVAGGYMVTLTVTDTSDNRGKDRLWVEVNDTMPPVADAGTDREVDPDVSTVLDGHASSDNVAVVAWTWQFEDAGRSVRLLGAGPSYTFKEAGTHTLTLTVEDAAGNTGVDLLEITVRDIAPPVAIACGQRAVSQGNTVLLDGSASWDNVLVSSYDWSFVADGAEVNLQGATQSFEFHTPGVYDITLAVTDTAGNSDSTTFELRVRDTVPPGPVARADAEARVGEEWVLDASSSYDNVGIVRYTWSFEEGGRLIELEGPVARHTFEEAGEYDVTLTVEDADGNVATQALTVTVTGSGWLYAVLVLALVVVVGGLLLARSRSRGEGDEDVGAGEDAVKDVDEDQQG